MLLAVPPNGDRLLPLGIPDRGILSPLICCWVVQVTSDLLSFWSSQYTAVKKEMKGRYPKHYWPDDPSVAEPTKMTKKQMQQQEQQHQPQPQQQRVTSKAKR